MFFILLGFDGNKVLLKYIDNDNPTFVSDMASKSTKCASNFWTDYYDLFLSEKTCEVNTVSENSSFILSCSCFKTVLFLDFSLPWWFYI